MIAPLAWCGRFDDAEAVATTVLAVAPDADVEFTALYGLSAVYGNRGDTASSITTLHRSCSSRAHPTTQCNACGAWLRSCHWSRVR